MMLTFTSFPGITGLLRFSMNLLLAMLLAAFTIQDEPVKPDESRFTPVVVADNLDEPMVFEVLKDGSAYIAERKGALKKYNPSTKTTELIATIAVNTKYTSAEGVVREAEEGLMGLTFDPNFEKNHWIYLYYAHPTEKKHVLSRWELIDDQLVESSKKDVIAVETQREVCCHTGGGMTWDKAGNLFLTVGNNTGNQQAAQTDERPGRASWDDQGHAGNTNDLRGKILRIHPQADGSYTIPEGNLYPKGTAKTRPEIYSMGHRNPWRISVDSQTGFVYWGEVGPDAGEDSEIGPRGYDELNQARKPGNFGWPWFVADDQAFPVFDYGTNKPLAKKDPKNLVNNSPNNTGLEKLFPTAPTFIYYPYGVSEKFPLVGSGSRSATGGPIYHQSDFKNPKRPWPAYYENKWIAADFSRGWIMAISMKSNGDYESMERVLPSYHPVQPIDIKFGPDGDLYILEYGSNWFRKSDNSRLVRIEYNGGNRKPVVQIATDKKGGSVPFTAKLSSEGTRDFDGDQLKYSWKITSSGAAPQTFQSASPTVTFSKPGVYSATLTVTDSKGAANTESIRIVAGNAPPQVSVNLAGNKTFFFADKPIAYTVDVADKEDGSLSEGKIKPSQVAVSIDYTSEGFDYAEVVQNQRSVDATTQFAVAQVLMGKSDCKVCHQPNAKSVGPSFADISNKYKGQAGALDQLVQKVLKGGSGVWGEVAMAAHPSLPIADAEVIVKYILNSTDKTLSSLSVKGEYTPAIPKGDNGNGSVLIRAAYTDHAVSGAKAIPAQTSEEMIILRSPEVNAAEAPIIKGAELKALGVAGLGFSVVSFQGSYLGFKQIDLTGIGQIELNASAETREGSIGGVIEIRLDSPTGDLIGEKQVDVAPPIDIAKVMAEMESEKKNAKPGEVVKQRNPFARPPVYIKVKDTSGKHDLYFVFKNDKAKPIQPLMSFSKIKFIQ
ncbi:PQQ-dependent sugar dehydrogenase [Dyadobacter pollutisoli]|uniref:PQQ-dependent sugar dehydrogenase n=1 Tax=Dyadobacter pollutisoli TaxID=2910158 RepID=A0A9E8NBP7_9BACT|nr:PQQ-dependent sugar dehydrogenase [Dyadobacter pollutisoli]WAC13028.1 PQQ-dependent sugar dehydrogenase [Dyadobacter pollutisoli]